MQIRRLRQDTRRYSILGQIIHFPVEVQGMLSTFPKSLPEDESFNLTVKKHLIHKTSAYSGAVGRNDLETWLNYLQTSPLYLVEEYRLILL